MYTISTNFIFNCTTNIYQTTCNQQMYLVVEPVPSTSHMALVSDNVVELALAQLASEPAHLQTFLHR